MILLGEDLKFSHLVVSDAASSRELSTDSCVHLLSFTRTFSAEQLNRRKGLYIPGSGSFGCLGFFGFVGFFYKMACARENKLNSSPTQISQCDINTIPQFSIVN